MFVCIRFTAHYKGWVPNWFEDFSGMLLDVKPEVEAFHSIGADVPNRLKLRKTQKWKQMDSILDVDRANDNTNEWLEIYQQLLSFGFNEEESMKSAKLYPHNLNKAIEEINNQQGHNNDQMMNEEKQQEIDNIMPHYHVIDTQGRVDISEKNEQEQSTPKYNIINKDI